VSVYDMAEFYVHTAQVEMHQGVNGYGEDIFAAPVSVACFLDEARKLVRDKTGEQVVSETTLATFPVSAPLFTADSRVTVNGDELRVIKTKVGDSGELDLPDHLEVSLT
jgi:hypothetical protein